MKQLSFLLTLALLLSHAPAHADVEITQLTLDTITIDTHSNITHIKSVQDLDTILQMNELVLAVLYDSSRVTSENVLPIAQDLFDTINHAGTPVRVIIVNIQDVPEITNTCPFTSSVALVSFIKGTKAEQLDLDIEQIAG